MKIVNKKNLTNHMQVWNLTKASFESIIFLNSPIIIEHLWKYAWMPIKEILIEDGVVIGQGLRQPWEPRGRNLLQGGPIGFEPHAPHIQDDAVLPVHGDHSPTILAKSRIGSGP